MDNNNFIDTCRLLGNYDVKMYMYTIALNMKHQEFFILQIITTYQNGQMLRK